MTLCAPDVINPIILIIFANGYEAIEYDVQINTGHGILSETATFSNYNFYPRYLRSKNKNGKQMIIQKESIKSDMSDFLNKYIAGATYSIIFYEDARDDGSIFTPLIKNSHNEIVSFLEMVNNYLIFVFPQIVDKSSFLYEFLTNYLPTICPRIFPFNTEFKWLEEEAYMLPNHEFLLVEKESLVKKFKEDIARKEKEIEANHKKYECLHNLLKESGDELVKSVQVFLEWLGFENVRIMDEQNPKKILEEDLQVEIEEGLLVIEVKGIGGTSTDGECSQIEKIKNRRARDRGKFDVFGLYIVNHQRYQPPLIRENPPFKKQQIEDAEGDGRGLLTTWQLFNLYYSIENECITKEEARKALLKYGLIEFSPQNCTPLGKPKNVFYRVDHNGKIIALDLQHKIENNNELVIKRGDRYLKTKILEIEVNSVKVESVDSGPAGIKVGIPIKKSDELFLKK